MRLFACLSLVVLALAPVGSATAQSAGAVESPPVVSPAPSSDPSQQIRCRRIDVIGSLIRRERVCKTLAEWRRLQDSGNDTARQQVENGRICAGGQCGGG